MRRPSGSVACILTRIRPLPFRSVLLLLCPPLQDKHANPCEDSLDSDDLLDLSKLQDHVRESKCLLLLQTCNVLTRPVPTLRLS